MFALARTAGGELLYFEFGQPLDPYLALEPRVRFVLADFENRRELLVDGSISQAVALLVQWLGEAGQDADRAIPILRALGFLRSANGADAVAAYLHHALPEVQTEAILAIGRIGSLEHLPVLEPFIAAPHPEVRRVAIVALGKSLNPDIFPALEVAAGADLELQELVEQGRRRQQAYERLDMRAFTYAVIATDEYEDLMRLLEATASYVIEMIADRQQPVVYRIRAVRLASLVRLLRARGALTVILADPAEPIELRREAAVAAGRCKAHPAVSSLIGYLDSSDARLQDAAITALGQIRLPEAVPPLLGHWNMRGGEAHERIRLAVRRIAKTPGTDLLIRLLRAGARWSPRDVYFISDTLRLRPEYRPGLLDTELASSNLEARRDAILLLAFLGGPEEAMKLAPVTEDPDHTNRELASAARAKLRPQ